MSRPTCSRPTTAPVRAPDLSAPDLSAPHLSAPDLSLVAEHLVGAHDPRASGAAGPALVRVRPTPEGLDLALAPLPPAVHPADALLGQVVPDEWTASGLVAPATAWSLDAARADRQPVAIAVLVGRDGVVAHATRDVATGGPLPLTTPPTGRVVDLLRCTLGLPTPPAEDATRCLWEALWLDAVVAGACAGGPTGLGPELADALTGSPDPQARTTWSRLRRLAAEPTSASGPHETAMADALSSLIDPATAAWMDDGCFARWTVGSLPPVDDLLDAVDALLPPGRAASVRHAVGRPAAPDDRRRGR